MSIKVHGGGKGSAEYLLMDFGHFPHKRYMAVAKSVKHVAKRRPKLMRRFIKNQSALFVTDRLEMLKAAFFPNLKKTLEAEPAGEKAGQRESRNSGARSRNYRDGDGAFSAQGHKVGTGVGNCRHTGICYQRA